MKQDSKYFFVSCDTKNDFKVNPIDPFWNPR